MNEVLIEAKINKSVVTMNLILGIILFIIFPIGLLFIISSFSTKYQTLTVTKHNIRGTYGNLGKRHFDLPMDSVTSIQFTKGGILVISTPSQKIIYGSILNAEDIVSVINDIIKNRQNHSETIISEQSSADEIKKFKDLLDADVITQEEFDAKKKQLLGL